MLNNPLAEIVSTEQDMIVQLNYLQMEAITDGQYEPQSVWPLTVLLVSIMLIGIVDIFLYKKRTLQMRICLFNIFLMFGLVAMIYYYARYAPVGVDRADSVLLWPIVIPFISIILTYLALKAIQKDDALVKSWERLR
jgi:UDP-N-acetylmuramyl pentapeptide phosphotransferase/UDP-N-acetylglucosamine-1-phosphate transferase